eukprot:gene14975-biopygen18668
MLERINARLAGQYAMYKQREEGRGYSWSRGAFSDVRNVNARADRRTNKWWPVSAHRFPPLHRPSVWSAGCKPALRIAPECGRSAAAGTRHVLFLFRKIWDRRNRSSE